MKKKPEAKIELDPVTIAEIGLSCYVLDIAIDRIASLTDQDMKTVKAELIEFAKEEYELEECLKKGIDHLIDRTAANREYIQQKGFGK